MELMQYDWIDNDPAAIDHLLTDDLWVMEQKMDGTRGLAVLRGGEPPQMLTRHGPLKHTAATQHLPEIWDTLQPLMDRLGQGSLAVLDGEIMIDSGEYRVFDLPELRLGGIDIRPSAMFQIRREVLESLLPGLGRVSVVYQARGEKAKRSMLHIADEQGVEGVVLKHREAEYLPGQRTNQGLKVKFVKTADVVVTASSRSRNSADREVGSFTMAVVAPPEWEMTPEQQQSVIDLAPGVPPLLPVGACSAIGKPHTEVGDVIEVAYLYWTGEALYQPRMVKVRDDKQVKDCRLDQFRPYTRDAL